MFYVSRSVLAFPPLPSQQTLGEIIKVSYESAIPISKFLVKAFDFQRNYTLAKGAKIERFFSADRRSIVFYRSVVVES